jgi:hypothetical protein
VSSRPTCREARKLSPAGPSPPISKKTAALRGAVACAPVIKLPKGSSRRHQGLQGDGDSVTNKPKPRSASPSEPLPVLDQPVGTLGRDMHAKPSQTQDPLVPPQQGRAAGQPQQGEDLCRCSRQKEELVAFRVVRAHNSLEGRPVDNSNRKFDGHNWERGDELDGPCLECEYLAQSGQRQMYQKEGEYGAGLPDTRPVCSGESLAEANAGLPYSSVFKDAVQVSGMRRGGRSGRRGSRCLVAPLHLTLHSTRGRGRALAGRLRGAERSLAGRLRGEDCLQTVERAGGSAGLLRRSPKEAEAFVGGTRSPRGIAQVSAACATHAAHAAIADAAHWAIAKNVAIAADATHAAVPDAAQSASHEQSHVHEPAKLVGGSLSNAHKGSLPSNLPVELHRGRQPDGDQGAGHKVVKHTSHSEDHKDAEGQMGQSPVGQVGEDCSAHSGCHEALSQHYNESPASDVVPTAHPTGQPLHLEAGKGPMFGNGTEVSECREGEHPHPEAEPSACGNDGEARILLQRLKDWACSQLHEPSSSPSTLPVPPPSSPPLLHPRPPQWFESSEGSHTHTPQSPQQPESCGNRAKDRVYTPAIPILQSTPSLKNGHTHTRALWPPQHQGACDNTDAVVDMHSQPQLQSGRAVHSSCTHPHTFAHWLVPESSHNQNGGPPSLSLPPYSLSSQQLEEHSQEHFESGMNHTPFPGFQGMQPWNPLLGGPLVPPDFWSQGEVRDRHVPSWDAKPRAHRGYHGASGQKIPDFAPRYTDVHNGFHIRGRDEPQRKLFGSIWETPVASAQRAGHGMGQSNRQGQFVNIPNYICSAWSQWDPRGHQEAVDQWQRETEEMDFQAQELKHSTRGELLTAPARSAKCPHVQRKAYPSDLLCLC